MGNNLLVFLYDVGEILSMIFAGQNQEGIEPANGQRGKK
jgi:hypothetical protein